MEERKWIWLVVLFGIGVGLWLLLAQPVDSFTPKEDSAPKPPLCSADPPPACVPDLAGGWGVCKDAQGRCQLGRPCGYILNCVDSFTCEDALGPCLGY